MFAYKLAAILGGTIAVAVAFAYASADVKDVSFPKAGKFDFSYSQPVVECPKIAWPYGCEWDTSVKSPTKHLVQRRGRHYRLFN